MNRKDELRRLAAKKGWYDGHSGKPCQCPTRTVSNSTATQTIEKPLSEGEKNAYRYGHAEGRRAQRGEINPYGKY